ncbi:MAG TPA: toprim domain-containing protein [Candidatus Acidoferrales bacterium]|jgi:hypothetical protein
MKELKLYQDQGNEASMDELVARLSKDSIGNLLLLDKDKGLRGKHGHFDQDGLCGYEVKNVNFTGFAPGGSKGLWLSHEAPGDTRLIFCESAIDALSHAVLFRDVRSRYASIGGKPNHQQPELIQAAASRMPANSEIISAMDADEDGRKLTEIVREAVVLSARSDLRFTVQVPDKAKDWNDLLRLKPKQFSPSSPNGAIGCRRLMRHFTRVSIPFPVEAVHSVRFHCGA